MESSTLPPQNPSPGSSKYQAQTALRPMNEPHAPITDDESNHQMQQKSPKSGVNMLLTLLSILVLAGVVGTTLYLYIQNRSVQNTQQATQTTDETQQIPKNEPVKEIAGTKVVGAENIEKMEKYGAICKRFTSLEEALAEREVACTLDLSGQDLTEVPEEVYELTNLNAIDLSNNDLSSFPTDLLNIGTLVSVDLSNNNISSIPQALQNQGASTDGTVAQKLQNLQLDGNPLTIEQIEQYEINPQ